MPTRNVSLTREQDAFIGKVVRTGEYQNASEAMRALQQRRREDSLKLTALRTEIAAGLRDLDNGDFVEVKATDLGRYLERLTPRRRAPKRTR